MNLNISLTQTKQEWETNSRLRWGVYAILALLWVYGLLALRDHSKAMRDEWSSAEAQIARAKSTAASGEWNTRALEIKSVVADLEGRLWREGSIGLGQAAAQEAVARSFVGVGITPRSLRSAIPESANVSDGEPIPIRIRAQFEFKPSTLYPWLHAITRGIHDNKPALLIDSLIIRGAPNSVVDVELIAYAVRATQPPAPSAPQNPSAAAK